MMNKRMSQSYMNVLPLLLVCVVHTGSALAGEAIQTQWSGGPGQVGPVLDLATEFWCDTGCQWVRSDDDLYLEYTAEEHALPGFTNSYSASADLDGDGDSDLVMADNYGGSLYWLENQGQGSSWVTHEIDNGIVAKSADCADLDGDGDSDIIIGLDWGLTCYRNTPGGWDCEVIAYKACYKAKPWDMDNDGDKDLVVVLWDIVLGYTISWMENEDGLGASWNEHFIYNCGSYAPFTPLGISDFDDDGDNDVATCGIPYNDDISWLENPGSTDSEWVQHLVGSINTPMGLETGDLDGDGDADMAITYFNAGQWYTAWYRNDNTSWSFFTLEEFCSSQPWESSIHILDVDDDGDLDFTATSCAIGLGPAMVWMENLGIGEYGWLPHVIKLGDYGNYIFSTTISDFDQDGNPDIACANGEGAYWFDLLRYPSEGYLDSSILDVCEEAEWNYISWTSTEPEGSDLWFQVRSSADGDPTNMGPWSTQVNEPGSLTNLMNDGDSYCQYKVTLASTNGDSTPVLRDVSISWQPFTSLSRESCSVDKPTLIIPLNPSRGLITIMYSLPDNHNARVSVYNISGRLCHRTNLEELDASGTLIISELPVGIYLVHLEGTQLNLTRSVILLE